MIRWVNQQKKYEINYYVINAFLKKALKYLRIQNKKISIILVSSEKIKKLNKDYRKKHYVTDVIAFPVDRDYPDRNYLGDIFICASVANKQAHQIGHSIEKEMATLVIHGILHLLGYDHLADNGEMESVQRKLLAGTKAQRHKACKISQKLL